MAERCAITQNKNWKIKFKIYWLSETELTLCNCAFLKSPTVLNLIQRKKFAVINFCFIFTDQAITFFVSELFKSYCCGKYQGNLCHTTCCLWRGTITQHLYLWYPDYSPLIYHLNWTHTKIFITIAEKKNSTSIERSNWQLQLPTPPHISFSAMFGLARQLLRQDTWTAQLLPQLFSTVIHSMCQVVQGITCRTWEQGGTAKSH